MSSDNNNINNSDILELENQLAATEQQALTIRQLIEEHQASQRVAQAASYQITLPNGVVMSFVSANDARLDNPAPQGATVTLKQTGNAGA